MYTTHQRQIARFAKKSPDNFSQVCLMVLLSIMQQWSTVGKQMQDVRANGLDSKFLFSVKRKGWEYILENKQELYNVVYGKLPLEKKERNKTGLATYSLHLSYKSNQGLSIRRYECKESFSLKNSNDRDDHAQ